MSRVTELEKLQVAHHEESRKQNDAFLIEIRNLKSALEKRADDEKKIKDDLERAVLEIADLKKNDARGNNDGNNLAAENEVLRQRNEDIQAELSALKADFDELRNRTKNDIEKEAVKTKEIKEELEKVKGNMATPTAGGSGDASPSFSDAIKKDMEKMEKKLEKSVVAKLTTVTKKVEKLTENTEKERRAKNIIVSGAPDRKERDFQKRKDSDLKFAKELLAHLELEDVVIEETLRLGAYNEDATYPRMLRITVSKESDKWRIIGKSKGLSRAPGDLTHVFVHPDLNKDDREKDKKLVQELKAKRLADKTKNYIIYRGRVKVKEVTEETIV